jgi:hypothetical protein
MNVIIEPLTPYNSFVSEPNGHYLVDTCIEHHVYHPAYDFEETNIPTIIEKLKELLQYFKGEHYIYIQKLVKCEPYIPKYSTQKKVRDWKITKGNTPIKVIVNNPKSPKVTAYSGSSFGEYGWFLKAEFGIEGIKDYGFGSIYPSYKWIKDEWANKTGREEEISHWQLEEIRKKRMVKCNICGKKIINLEAEQCSKCGKYFCKECLTGDVCQDCQGED